ncbi:MAG: hypothetical protein V4710_11615 [Verrucomicrobiota bacterium]
MRIVPITNSRRLQLLNKADQSHHWHDCEEFRRCIICEQVFNGHQVRLSWFRRGLLKLHCPTPGCPGGPSAWVHPGNPLVSHEAWEDWERIIRDMEASAS